MNISPSVSHIANVVEAGVKVDVDNPPVMILFSDLEDYHILNNLGMKIVPFADSPISYVKGIDHQLTPIESILAVDHSHYYDRMKIAAALHTLDLRGLAYVKIPAEGDEYPENRLPILFVSDSGIVDETIWKSVTVEEAKKLLASRTIQDISAELDLLSKEMDSAS